MFELLFIAFLLLFGGLFILKALFFLLGMIFAGVGVLLKVILAVVFGVIFFPVGAAVLGVVFSGGFLVFLLIATALGALFSDRNRGHEHSREYIRNH